MLGSQYKGRASGWLYNVGKWKESNDRVMKLIDSVTMMGKDQQSSSSKESRDAMGDARCVGQSPNGKWS